MDEHAQFANKHAKNFDFPHSTMRRAENFSLFFSAIQTTICIHGLFGT